MPSKATRSHVAATAVCACVVLVASQTIAAPGSGRGSVPRDDPRELYLAACSTCHGQDGRGAPHSLDAFPTLPPDFTECNFATREPDADWIAVIRKGGPVRGFSRMMPAFEGLLTERQSADVLEHVRSFCRSEAWPRGELNLPRALFTTKAYPEDEAVVTATFENENRGVATSELAYERRLRTRTQIEIAAPFGWREDVSRDGAGDERGWSSGLGDVTAGIKTVLHHDLEHGSILSFGTEVILPTGDEERGFGRGTTILEPFFAYGQILSNGFFLQGQTGAGVSFDDDEAEHEAFARVALGRTFTSGRYGRAWSPMMEVLADRELSSDATTLWSLVPQMQVTLNQRQHVMLNAGARVPVNETDARDTHFVVYLLWDWFDGGFAEGW